MGTNNIDINSFHEVIADLASEGMLRTSQEELASRITEYDEEIKSLCKELKRLGKKREVKIQSEEKLKKLKRKRLYLLGGFVVSMVIIFAPAAFLPIDTLSYPSLLFWIGALGGSFCLAGQAGLHFNICDVEEIAKLSLEEIDEKIRGLEESLQYKRNDRDHVEKILEYVNQELDVIDQAIASREFDGQMSTLQNSMGAEDDLEQRDIRQDGLDQEDTKGNGLRRVRTNEKSITS